MESNSQKWKTISRKNFVNCELNFHKNSEFARMPHTRYVELHQYDNRFEYEIRFKLKK